MGIIRQSAEEFSFVDGFGDDIRDGVLYGFPQEVLSAIHEQHPQIRIVFYVPEKKHMLFAKGDNGQMFFLRDVEPGETWNILDRLDEAGWESRNLLKKEHLRARQKRLGEHFKKEDEDYKREAMKNCDPHFAEWLIRKYREKELNMGDPYPTISVPRSAPV